LNGARIGATVDIRTMGALQADAFAAGGSVRAIYNDLADYDPSASNQHADGHIAAVAAVRPRRERRRANGSPWSASILWLRSPDAARLQQVLVNS
jgi:hypothetical protein